MTSEHSLATRPSPARLRLREATASNHEAVDGLFSAFILDLAADYRAFLETQYACVAPIEDALSAAGARTILPDWPARRRAALLAADLADLGAALPGPAPAATIRLSGPGAVLGAIYVLEGSRFGGAVLARRLPPEAPKRFLAAAAPVPSWRTLVAALDEHLAAPPVLDEAIGAARAVFAAFENAARHRLEPGLD